MQGGLVTEEGFVTEGLVKEEFVAVCVCYRGSLFLRRIVAERLCNGGRFGAEGLATEGLVAVGTYCRGGLSRRRGLSQRGML